MNYLSKNIRFLRKQRNLSQPQLGKLVNKSESAIQSWETGYRSPSIKLAAQLSDIFEVDINDLFYVDLQNAVSKQNLDLSKMFKEVHPIDTVKLPMLGSVACGEPIFADEDRESYVLVGAEIKADFCLRCQGDSMINARINDGDIVFIRKQDIVNNGEIAVVIIDDEATLKRFYYYKEQNMVILKPENPKYEDKILTGEQLEKVKVLGKAIAFQSDVI